MSDSVTPWTVAHQAPLSMGFSRQEYCSGLPFPSPGDLPTLGPNPRLLHWQAGSLPSEPPFLALGREAKKRLQQSGSPVPGYTGG